MAPGNQRQTRNRGSVRSSRKKKIHQVIKRIQSVFFGRLDGAEHNSAGSGAPGGVGKKEILAVNNKGFDGAPGAVVGNFEAVIQEIALKVSLHHPQMLMPLSFCSPITPKGTLTKLRNGTGRIDAKTLNKLCTKFNCQPGDLMEYVEDENEAPPTA